MFRIRRMVETPFAAMRSAKDSRETRAIAGTQAADRTWDHLKNGAAIKNKSLSERHQGEARCVKNVNRAFAWACLHNHPACDCAAVAAVLWQ